jgi:hypothetical protein
MKREGVRLFWLWLLPLFVSADFLHWQGDYTQAHTLARTSGKPLLVFVAKAEDARTNEVLRTVFMQHPYIQTLQKKTVAVMVTYEKASSYPIEMYYTTTFPALFLVDPKTELFMRPPLYGTQITPSQIEKIIVELEQHQI